MTVVRFETFQPSLWISIYIATKRDFPTFPSQQPHEFAVPIQYFVPKLLNKTQSWTSSRINTWTDELELCFVSYWPHQTSLTSYFIHIKSLCIKWVWKKFDLSWNLSSTSNYDQQKWNHFRNTSHFLYRSNKVINQDGVTVVKPVLIISVSGNGKFNTKSHVNDVKNLTINVPCT